MRLLVALVTDWVSYHNYVKILLEISLTGNKKTLQNSYAKLSFQIHFIAEKTVFLPFINCSYCLNWWTPESRCRMVYWETILQTYSVLPLYYDANHCRHIDPQTCTHIKFLVSIGIYKFCLWNTWKFKGNCRRIIDISEKLRKRMKLQIIPVSIYGNTRTKSLMVSS